MLSFHQVCASYGKNQVLDHIDFSLVPHKLTAVVGRNGSGKSTLVSCVNQELPYTGEITFSDRNLAVMTLRERAQLISILPQTLHSPAVTVEELTAFGRNPYLDFGKRMSPKDWQAVDDALEAIGISGLRDKLVTELSGGERQKAYLAMVLAQNTRVMILDEPTTYMDMEYEAAFFRLLETLKTKRKITFLVIMHNLSQAVRYASSCWMGGAYATRETHGLAWPAECWSRCFMSDSIRRRITDSTSQLRKQGGQRHPGGRFMDSGSSVAPLWCMTSITLNPSN